MKPNATERPCTISTAPKTRATRTATAKSKERTCARAREKAAEFLIRLSPLISSRTTQPGPARLPPPHASSRLMPDETDLLEIEEQTLIVPGVLCVSPMASDANANASAG